MPIPKIKNTTFGILHVKKYILSNSTDVLMSDRNVRKIKTVGLLLLRYGTNGGADHVYTIY